MLVLENGRPTSAEGRLDKEIRCYDFLDRLGVSYQRIDHEPAMTMEVCEEIDHALQAVICKNLFLCNRQETEFYLLMMPGDKKFKTKDLSAQLGVSRLSFAGEKYMEEFLDITPGSVSVLGLMNDVNHRVKLCIDEEVLQGEELGCHPCINTSSIKFSVKDLQEKVIPAMGHDVTIVSLPRYEEGLDSLTFRSILPEEADEAVEIEHICFPPHEACSEKAMKERIAKATELFLVAKDPATGKIAGFLNGIATDEEAFRDAFFTDISLCDLNGKNVMLVGLDVRPEYRGKHLARTIVEKYAQRERAKGRKCLFLTCLAEKVPMYLKFGFVDLGMANSSWGGEEWHEMRYDL